VSTANEVGVVKVYGGGRALTIPSQLPLLDAVTVNVMALAVLTTLRLDKAPPPVVAAVRVRAVGDTTSWPWLNPYLAVARNTRSNNRIFQSTFITLLMFWAPGRPPYGLVSLAGPLFVLRVEEDEDAVFYRR
jgi:hypothetical protein